MMEIVGYAATYVVAAIIIGYAIMAGSAFTFRKGGLETIPWVVIPTIVFWIVAFVVGVFLLGRYA